MALSKALSEHQGIPLYQYFNHCFGQPSMSLPVPMVNILNGGAHANNNIDFQEFMIMPSGFDHFSTALQCAAEVFQHLKQILAKAGHNTSVGDEGGFAPNLESNEHALEVVLQAIEQAGYQPQHEVKIALDVASSEFYKNGQYHLQGERTSYTSEEFAELLTNWCQRYPIASIEDGMAENDWQGWSLLTQKIGQQVQLVGDDLFVTNARIIQQGIDRQVANSVLIKVNQIGTISETIEAMQLAEKAHYRNVVSHRSGETEDTLIADLAVGSGAKQIKTGSMCRSDRTAKYNQLLRIEEQLVHQLGHQLGHQASYAGHALFA